jgi:hypothetical protein
MHRGIIAYHLSFVQLTGNARTRLNPGVKRRIYLTRPKRDLWENRTELRDLPDLCHPHASWMFNYPNQCYNSSCPNQTESYLFNKPGEKPGKSSPSHFGNNLVN